MGPFIIESEKEKVKIDHLLDLFSLYYSDVHAYGVCLGFHQDQVEDAIHDVFLKLYRNQSIKLNDKTIKPYLFKSVRNKLIDYGRERSTEDKFALEYSNDFVLDLSVEDEYIHDEETNSVKEKVEHILASLTSHQREIIYLRYLEEMSYDEIASLLDMKVQSVRGQVFKVLQKLRRKSSEEWIVAIFLILQNFL